MIKKEKKDPYKCLGVPNTASDDDIKKAYRKLAMKYHPDKNHGNEASEEAFKDIASSYDILSNPDKRRQYDSGGLDSQMPFGFNVSDLFAGQVFNSQGQGFNIKFGDRQAYSSIPKDIRTGLALKLEDAYKGCSVKLEYQRYRFCKPCSEKGKGDTKDTKVCELCKGSGRMSIMKCPACAGSGKTCKHCSGSGHIKEKRHVMANIPARLKFGSVITLPKEGNVSKEGVQGDLIIQVSFVPKDDAARLIVQRDGTINHWIYIPWDLALENKSIQLSLYKESEPISLQLSSSRENGAEYTINGKGWDNSKPLVVKVLFNLPVNMKDEDRMNIANILKKYADPNRNKL